MHVIIAKLLSLEIIRVQLGIDWLQIRVCKLYFSPILGTSFVETKYEEVKNLRNCLKVLYFMSGLIGNLILTIVFFIMYIEFNKYLFISMSIINLLIVVLSLLPFGKSDMKCLLSFIKDN